MKKLGFLLQFAILFGVQAQQTKVSGKVTEASTGSPIPFATVSFTGTTEGAITDFEGNFVAETSTVVDSIEVRYVGFNARIKPLARGSSQIINFQLEEANVTLNEVVIVPGENPAFEILRRTIKNKSLNDKRELDAYEYESYTRTELDIDNISEKMRNRKIMQKITNVLDSIEQIAGEDGKPVLPIFSSEAISRFYYRKNPAARHEEIIRTRMSGIGISDGTLTSQVIGSTYQEYNFYQNWMGIVTKEFASPIADGWKVLYEYELVDSLFVNDDFCYKIEFFPKQEQDLAFTGTMWITKNEYALKQIDASVPAKANLNFLERLKIQQELEKTNAGPWVPTKTRVVIDVKEVTKNTAGVLAKFYISNKDIIVNKPREDRFYLNPISMDSLVREPDETYWQRNRHDSLSQTEENVFMMIDSLKEIRQIKIATELTKFAVTGYIKTGKIDIGPYTTFFGNNNIEGIRLGFGARTNIDFSNKWVFGGYVGYGFDDERLKYNFYLSHILNRNPWTVLRYEQQEEIDQVWLLNENVDANSLFYSLSRFGTLTQPFSKKKYRLAYSKQLGQGLNAELALRHESHRPLFPFNYFEDEARTTTASAYEISEASINVRYGKDEVFVINDNERLSLGTTRSPLISVRYAYGPDNVLNSDFSYHKLQASISKQQKMGVLGVSNFRLGGGYFFGQAPYSMLFNPIGNETPFFVGFAYNLMDFFEFSSDRFVELRYRHSFEGFILNRIPLLKKLKWRAIVSANGLLGDIRQENIDISQFELDAGGQPTLPFTPWTATPYIEVGYGISNILRIFSIQAFHRLTYLHVNARDFGVKFNVDISL